MWNYLIALSLLSPVLGTAACIAVQGSQILAKDVAQIDPAFASLNPDLPFSYAPAIGMQRVIPVSEIASWAVKAGIQTKLSGPACFERPVHTFDTTEIAAAIKRAFPKSKITQVDVLEICKCRVPSGRLEFTAEGASAPPASHPGLPVLWTGQLFSESGPPYTVWARVRVLATSNIVRSRKTLRAREVLQNDLLENVEITDSPLRLRQPDSLENYSGKVLNRDVHAGEYLDPSFVIPLPDIPRGSTVTVQVVNGSTQLELKARAENSGNAGETVILTNPSGLRRFSAVVVGPGTARIDLSRGTSPEPKERNGAFPVTTFRGTL